MYKFCPFMSFQTSNDNEIYCLEKECGLWNKEKGQCCLLTLAIAAADKPSGGSSISQQAEYVYNTAPATVPNSSGDWVNPHPYRTDCALEKGII